MKTMIRMEVKNFQKALKCLGSVVNNRSALPILKNILMEYDEERKMFRLEGSDAENTLQIDCVAPNEAGEQQAWALMIENDRKDPFERICIDFEKLNAAISTLPSALTLMVWIESETGDQVQMRVDYQTGEFILPCEKGDDFPRMTPVVLPESTQPGTNTTPLCSFSIDAKWLISRMQSARAATASGSAAELRPIMGCECLDVDPEGLTIVASDGHQLYKDRMQVGVGTGFLQMFARNEKGEPQRNYRLLLPPKGASIAVRTFHPEGEITIAADTQKMSMTVEGMRIICTTFDGKYPNYNSVIPNNPHACVVDRKMLNMALQRVRIFADDVSELASISREDNNIIIRAEDSVNACRSSERIAIQNDDTTLPADFVIGFKHSTLREMISCTDADNLIMKFDNKTMPITITEEDKESQLFILVMPMLINQ